MDTIIPDIDNDPRLVEGALPILHIPDGVGTERPAIVEALARLNAMDKMMAAGYVFTRAQVERLGWPDGTHIDWIPLRQPSSLPSSASDSRQMMEQRLAGLELYVKTLITTLRLAGLIP